MDEVVAVIGAGSWGTTLAKVCGENQRKTLLWARRPDLCREINQTRMNRAYLPDVELTPLVEATDSLKRVCQSAKLIFLVVPSHGFRRVAFELGEFLTGEHVIVHATKGIEQGSFKRMSELVREETCVRKIGVLSGPNLALELAARHPTGTLVASRYREVFERSRAVLHNDYFRVYSGDDVIGAELAGAFKNIVALAAGLASGLGFGRNTMALLLTRGISEMARLGVALGADPFTFGGMAGFGDLVATCSSNLSRNYQVGMRLARGESLAEIQSHMQMVAEGVKTTHAVHEYADGHDIDLPIVRGVHRVLFENRGVKEVLAELMAVPTGPEFAMPPIARPAID